MNPAARCFSRLRERKSPDGRARQQDFFHAAQMRDALRRRK
jgi:hypothetical protein